MIKTINLTAGVEMAVELAGGVHARIENRGTGIVYAAKSDNVTAGEDGVIAVTGGATKYLKNACSYANYEGNFGYKGTIYLKSSESGIVEIETGDYFFDSANKSEGGVSSGKFMRVVDRVDSKDDLPITANEGDVYLVGLETDEDCEEYVYTTQKGWEHIGNTAVDLSGYVKDTDIPSTMAEYGIESKDDISTLKSQLESKLDKPEWSDVAGIRMDFENKTFDRLAGAVGLSHGTDFNKFPTYAEMRRCNLSDNGVVNAYYGDENYKEDGTNGQIMVEIPKFYYKVVPLKLDRITDGKGFHIRKAEYYVSQRPIDGFKIHPAFTITGEEHDYIYIGAYEGCLYDASASAYITDDSQVMVVGEDKLSSIAGVKPMSGASQNLTRANSETLAQNRGSIWHTDNIFVDSAVQMLLMIETGGNSQNTIGNGIVSKADGTGNMSENTGATSSLGNSSSSGEIPNGAVSYRGIENFWGNIWTWSEGVNIWGDGTLKGGVPYIATTSTFTADEKITGYESAGFTLTNAGGYIKAFGYNKTKYDWLFLPSEVGGTQSDATCGDYTSVASSPSGFRVALLGDRWCDGSKAGSFCWYLSNGSSDRGRGIGARPTVL